MIVNLSFLLIYVAGNTVEPTPSKSTDNSEADDVAGPSRSSARRRLLNLPKPVPDIPKRGTMVTSLNNF